MDLSALIYVALFAGWIFYMIPKFMSDHEELATTRSLQDFSARLRVFAATRTTSRTNLLGEDEPTVEISMDELRRLEDEHRGSSRAEGVVSRPLPTRAAAKRAAQRRRRVLTVLLLVTTVVGVLAGFALAPVWAPAIPATLVLLFMISARRSVRRMKATRRAVVQPVIPVEAEVVTVSEPAPIITHESDIEAELILSVAADNVADDEAAAAADRLWDPVPMTLPTYLDKPAARRTVMSIELNQGIVSSGHDAADSELVKAAEAAAQADDTPVDLEAPRRAAGA